MNSYKKCRRSSIRLKKIEHLEKVSVLKWQPETIKKENSRVNFVRMNSRSNLSLHLKIEHDFKHVYFCGECEMPFQIKSELNEQEKN